MFLSKYGVTIFYIWIVQYVASISDNGHCSITLRDKAFQSPTKIIPVSSDAMGCSNIAGDLAFNISLCPDKRYLKFSVTLNETQDLTVSLCYNIQSTMDWLNLASHCYRIEITSLEKNGQLDCWFPMERIELRPTITATLNISQAYKCHTAYGELSTGTLDIEKSCTSTCDIPATYVRHIVSCDSTVTVSHDPNIVIRDATYTSNNSPTCTDVEMKAIQQDKRSTEFLIVCNQTGPGFILIWYVKNEVYCQRQHDIQILCNTASITVDSPAVTGRRLQTSGQQHGSTIYVIATVISLTVIAITTTVAFVAVRRRKKLRNRQQSRRPVYYRATPANGTHQAQPLID